MFTAGTSEALASAESEAGMYNQTEKAEHLGAVGGHDLLPPTDLCGHTDELKGQRVGVKMSVLGTNSGQG